MNLTAIALIAAAIVNGANPNAQLGFYPSSAKVTRIENDTVYIEDCAGFEWEFDGVEDWEENDACAVLFCDNGTENIKDDIIVNVRYTGTCSN